MPADSSCCFSASSLWTASSRFWSSRRSSRSLRQQAVSSRAFKSASVFSLHRRDSSSKASPLSGSPSSSRKLFRWSRRPKSAVSAAVTVSLALSSAFWSSGSVVSSLAFSCSTLDFCSRSWIMAPACSFPASSAVSAALISAAARLWKNVLHSRSSQDMAMSNSSPASALRLSSSSRSRRPPCMAAALASIMACLTRSASFFFLSSSGFSGAPVKSLAGSGWWTEPQTGHFSPSVRFLARSPAWAS